MRVQPSCKIGGEMQRRIHRDRRRLLQYSDLIRALNHDLESDAYVLLLATSTFVLLLDLGPAEERLRMFLEQYWGGPTTYSEQRGHPRLRMRHHPFKVTPAQRDRWLLHMMAAVDTLDLAAGQRPAAARLPRAGRPQPGQQPSTRT